MSSLLDVYIKRTQGKCDQPAQKSDLHSILVSYGGANLPLPVSLTSSIKIVLVK